MFGLGGGGGRKEASHSPVAPLPDFGFGKMGYWPPQRWCLETWFSGRLGSVRLPVGLDGLKGLFQPKRFYDSMILWFLS